MEVSFLLPQTWKLFLLLVLSNILSEFGSPAAIPLWRAKKLFLESSIDSVRVRDRSKRSGDQTDSSSAGADCGDPGIPENGLRQGNNFYIGSVLFFVCNSGYVLRGSGVLTCRYGDNNELYWDADLPQCVGKQLMHG